MMRKLSHNAAGRVAGLPVHHPGAAISPGLKSVFGLVAGFLLLLSSGCGLILSSVTGSLSENLSQAILDNDDPDTVRDALPAYLLLTDALLRTSPGNRSLLLAASALYGSYAVGFTEDSERARRLTQRSLDYALEAACRADTESCAIKNMPIDDFNDWVASRTRGDAQLLYEVGVAWAGWMQARSDDFRAIVDLPRVQGLMLRVVELDETWDDGGAHLYLGVFDTLLPKAYGGHPERGRKHFERAEELSGGRYLMTKVLYARQYARLIHDRALHDRLLEEVMSSDPSLPGKTLINLIAKEQARELLMTADEYF